MKTRLFITLFLYSGYFLWAADVPPTWQVVPTDFQYSMTITASVKVAGNFLNSEDDMVGVFVGSELRGVGRLSAVGTFTNRRSFIQVHSNTSAGEVLIFRMYEAASDRVVDAIGTLVFQGDLTVGSVAHPYAITDNYGPTDLHLSSQEVPENMPVNTQVALISAQDRDVNEQITFSLVGGEGSIDNPSFQVDGHVLRVRNSLDYEQKNSYSVRIRATDSKGEYIEGDFVLNVQDVNDPPTQVTLSTYELVENSPLGWVVATFAVVDQDINPSTYVYSFVSGLGDDNNNDFLINEDRLLLNTHVDHEDKQQYTLRVRATDQEGISREEALVITVTDVNEAPTDIRPTAFSVGEKSRTGTTVVFLIAVDEDVQDTHSFRLLNETITFGITGDELVLVTELDYEKRSLYFLDVEVTDAGGLSHILRLSVTVENQNDLPTSINFIPENIQEGMPVNSFVGRFSTSDQDVGAVFTYTLVSGIGDANNAFFSITDDKLYTAQALDYESEPLLTFRVRSSEESGGTVDFIEEMFRVSIRNINESPVSLLLTNNTVQENQLPGTPIGQFTVRDQDQNDTHRFSLVAGSGSTDNSLFLVEGETLKTRTMLDHEASATRTVRVRVTDAAGAFYEESFTITVQNGNESPANLRLSSNEVAENSPAGTEVGTLSVTDPDDFTVISYDLQNTIDGNNFYITDDKLFTRIPLNYEVQIFYAIRVLATDDGNNTLTQEFVIILTDINEAPTDITLPRAEINENVAVNTVVGELYTIDPDAGDVFSYTFVSGVGSDDNDDFIIRDGQLRNRVVFDYESQHAYKVRVASTDKGGITTETSLEIAVLDVDEAPVDIRFNPLPLPENQPRGVRVGSLQTVDPDESESFIYTLITGVGSDNNVDFFVADGELFAATSFDYEQTPTLSIRVQVRDKSNLFYTRQLIIPVQDKNDVHTDCRLSTNSVLETLPLGTIVGTLSVVDQDNDPITYRIVESSLVNSFRIEGSDLLTNKVFNFEEQFLFRIVVAAIDQAGNVLQQAFQIDIIDVDDPPSALTLSSQIIEENQEIGTHVGDLSIIDEDTDSNTDVFTYTLVPGVGDEDNGDFQLVGNQLLTAVELDYESRQNPKIRVRAIASNGNMVVGQFTLVIKGNNDAPSAVQFLRESVEENQPVGTLVTTMRTDDQDSDDVFLYRIVGSVGTVSLLEVRGDRLYTLAIFNHEAQAEYTFGIESRDRLGSKVTTPFTLQIKDINDPPELIPGALTVLENSPKDTFVGTIAAEDPDEDQVGTLTYQLYYSGEGDIMNDNFYINPQSGQVHVRTPTALNYEVAKVQKIEVEVTDDGEPPSSSRLVYAIQITDVKEKVLPAALFISPNGDNMNDYWVVDNVALYAALELLIFSSLGQIMYQTYNYQNDWQGTFRNKTLPRGVYYYVFRDTNGKPIYRGEISILR